MFLWMGMQADSKWVQDVFGVPTVSRIDIEKVINIYIKKNIYISLYTYE